MRGVQCCYFTQCSGAIRLKDLEKGLGLDMDAKMVILGENQTLLKLEQEIPPTESSSHIAMYDTVPGYQELLKTAPSGSSTYRLRNISRKLLRRVWLEDLIEISPWILQFISVLGTH